MSVVSVVMPARRGRPSGKHHLRLPIIAPKDDIIIDSHLQAAEKLASISISRPRVRLPPRSRTGCWTCRSRKVKCDEGHPQCDQCARLGHVCDYQPRLSFKDDTRRTVRRMAEVNTAGNVVWDPTSSACSKANIDVAKTTDVLPPFSLLASDEERERKAQASNPGTYHVVFVPDSFADLPEYSQARPERNPRASVANSTVSRDGEEESESFVEARGPNLVIMKRFQDITRRPSSRCRSSTLSPTSDMLGSLSPTVESKAATEEEFTYFPVQSAELENQETTLLQHFRKVVWKQLIPGEPVFDNLDDNSLNADVFEREAAGFPPLFHAMMAVSALSLAHQDGGQSIDGLQYYQQAFPSLQNSIRSSEDLLSDGLFLTHFLLLIYEIAAAEPTGSNLWSHHISRLLHISILRRSAPRPERYPFIIWWVLNIDLYALFSGAGTGEFVGAMLENRCLPEPECLLYPVGSEGYSLMFPEEHDTLPVFLRLYQDTFVLAARVAFLASEIRRSRKSTGMLSPSDHQQRELSGLREALRETWNSPNIRYLIQQQMHLTRRSRDVLQQSSSLLHTALLFSYTSVWPAQRLGPAAYPENILQPHITAILQIAENAITQVGGAGCRFITFPLFLAGVVTTSHEQKMVVMELLSNMAREEMGYDAATTRYILQVVYERQTQRLINLGHALDVDWVDLMDQHDLQMVNFG